MTACVSPQLRTIVLESDAPTREVTVKNIIELSEGDYFGFDSLNRPVTIIEREGFAFAYNNFTTNFCLEGEVAEPIAMMDDNLFYSVKNSLSTSVKMCSQSNGDPQLIMNYATDACIVPPRLSDGVVTVLLQIKDKYLLQSYEVASGKISTSQMNSLVPSELQSNLDDITILDIFYAGKGRLVLQATLSSGATYIIVTQGDKPAISFETSKKKASYVSGMLYYTDKLGRLLMLDLGKAEEAVIAESADTFSVSADGRVVAYSVKDGLANKLFILRPTEARESLIDIRNGLESFSLNKDGTRLLSKCKESDGSYLLYELNY